MSIIHNSGVIAIASRKPIGAALKLSNIFVSDSDPVSPFYSEAGFQLTNGGLFRTNTGGVYSNVESGLQWIDDGGATAGEYESYFTKTGGLATLTVGTLDTWQTLSTTRTWYISSSASGFQSLQGTLTVREIANPSNSVSCSVTLQIENDVL